MKSELINRFWEFNNKCRVGSTPALLYNFLLYKSSKIQNDNFNLSDIEVSNELCINPNTVKSARLRLAQLNLIRISIKNGFACNYQLIYDFSPENEVIPKEKKKFSKKIKRKEISVSNLDKSTDFKNTMNNGFDNSNANIPSQEEFLEFAKKIKGYDAKIKNLVIEKYDSWKINNWNNSIGKPITNWKSSLKSIIPYLLDEEKDFEKIDLNFLPNPINPIKTINEH